MKRSNHVLSAAVASFAIVASSSAALAFCRTSSCPNVGTSQVCTPALPGDCGTPLFWANPCVGWSLQQDASPQVTFAAMQSLVTNAFHTWTSAQCPGGGSPRMAVFQADPAVCTLHEYNQKAGNANVIVFRDQGWPYEGSANTLALTTVTYNLDTGEIYDADMELNSADNHFTTSDTNVEFDLPSIVTHEAGHFLGLAHSVDATATMYPDYMQHTINLRNLSADDIAGICTIYPPGNIPSDCDITPRHGFSALCAADQPVDEGGCTAVAAGTASRGAAWSGMAAVLGALVLAARRMRPAHRRSKRG
ncbi:Hypothetical protein A7982_02459 [Minicystis rosea]|nr:Hypothetical protein A7982_02459 [Minicystis rosea]